MTGAGGDRPRLVALRALKLGDLLVGVPALRALARACSEHRRILAAPAWLAPLAALTGAVDEVVDTAPLTPLPAALHRADLAVNLHGRGPQSSRLLAASRPRRLIAFAHPEVPATAGGPAWREDEHEVARWSRLLSESGIPADPADLRLPPPPADPLPGAPGAVLIHPGASSPARRWPVDRWAAVAAAVAAGGRRVVVTGSPGEAARCREVAARAGLPREAAAGGRTGLLELAATVHAATAVVSGDTGVAHLAAALAVPSVVLFGPVPPARWGPPPGGRHVALWAGGHGDPHGDQVDPGLLALTPGDVLAALEQVVPAGRG